MASITERLEEEFNDIDVITPNHNEAVIGYCEPQEGKDFEAEVIYYFGKFYHDGVTVRCYYWKAKD